MDCAQPAGRFHRTCPAGAASSDPQDLRRERAHRLRHRRPALRGVESWLYDLVLALGREPGVEPVVVNVSGTGIRHQEFLQAGVEVHAAGSSLSCLSTHRLDTAIRLRGLLKSICPHVVHTLHFSGNYFGRLACLGLDIPVVVHLRNIKRERKAHRRWADKILSFATDRYLCVSRQVADTVRLDHNAARRPVQVLYNAVDLAKLDVPPADLSAFRRGNERVLLAVDGWLSRRTICSCCGFSPGSWNVVPTRCS